jgi:hypothetical protein
MHARQSEFSIFYIFYEYSILYELRIDQLSDKSFTFLFYITFHFLSKYIIFDIL